MKRLIASWCAAGLIAFTGCNSSDTGGRSGGTATTDSKGNVTRTASSHKETFKLNGPAIPTKLEQGTTKNFTISISRGSEFKDDVNLKAESPDPKLHVTLQPSAFKGSEMKDVQVTVKADDDAKIGEDDVSITGTPHAGAPTTLAVKIDVAAKPTNK